MCFHSPYQQCMSSAYRPVEKAKPTNFRPSNRLLIPWPFDASSLGTNKNHFLWGRESKSEEVAKLRNVSIIVGPQNFCQWVVKVFSSQPHVKISTQCFCPFVGQSAFQLVVLWCGWCISIGIFWYFIELSTTHSLRHNESMECPAVTISFHRANPFTLTVRSIDAYILLTAWGFCLQG